MSGARAAIEEYHGRPIGIADLVGRDRPLVIRGLCRDWPMVTWARQSDTAFAQGLAALDSGGEVDALLMPPEEGGVVGYNADFDGFNYAHHRISITQGLQRLAQYSRQENPPGLALQSALISACLPGLLDSHALPFLDGVVQPRIWIGNRVTTPAHFDEYHNVACVACGGRRFTLFAPEQVRNLYVGPLDFAPTGAAISMARPDRQDDLRFPRLKQALAAAQVAELGPGDAIYIPPMWWHQVESLEQINALVNYWWKPVPADGHAPGTALGCLMHCILAFKSLTPAERTAWKTLLDHYVFDDEDPAAHIPAERRGVLGTLTSGQLAALRETIRRYL
ncbi:cupin-like domain-containing protein [Rhodanobacter sp. Col0626]|uniref:cupin-like domain-containing protein n=1 Tax=Rhodanobacter sp. Col0626 TaxID=3415679 RepID=UPI003CEB9E9F